MGKRSLTKGKNWERAVVNMFQRWGFIADRTPAMLESVRGPTGIDVRAMGGTKKTCQLRLAVQCKVGARPDAWRALRECEASAHARELPIAIVRRNMAKGRPVQTVVVMSPETFKRLVVPEDT